MVYAMLLLFLLFLFIDQSATLSSCSFSQQIYTNNSPVLNQFQFPNQTSISLTAYYAFVSPSNQSYSTFELGLIYPFSFSNYLVPFPIIFNCSSMVRSCQLKTLALTKTLARDSESINVILTPFNYSTTTTTTTTLFNQMGLYLRQGRYQLSNCTLNDGQLLTDPSQIFSIDIQYEEAVGTSCSVNSTSCGSTLLSTCSSSSLTCTCRSSFVPVPFNGSLYCADALNASNCQIFPSRCVTWCNATSNDLCICPSETVKVIRNNLYVCELPVNALNCTVDDPILRCPLGYCCTTGQCQSCSSTNPVTSTTTSGQNTNSNNSTDQNLRIALGVVVGVLGTSVLILLVTFCWLRRRQRRRRIAAENSSTKSSLYITPTEVQHQSSSSNGIYQLPDTEIDVDRQTHRFSPFYRTDSFRQAIQSGQQPSNITMEHVSARRDSFVETVSNQREDLPMGTYNNLQYPLSSPTISDERSFSDADFYQIINSSSSPRILTYAV